MGGLTRALLLALGAATLAGCRRGDAAAGRAGGGPYADKVSEAMPLIEQATGVKFKTRPKLEVRSRAQVRDFLVRQFDESEPQQELAGEEATYRLFGLLPDTLDLRRLLLDVLEEQIVGYYDPRTKVLYVVEGAAEELANITITHELVHALQDQYANLDSLQHADMDDDRKAAAHAVIEGQATYEQMAMMVGGGGNIAARLPGGWDQMRELIRQNSESQPKFANAPMVIQEEMLFPYINGAEFVRRFKERRPGALPLDSLPASTEQVMHERAYFDRRDSPVRVTLPALANTIHENTLGEFTTRLVLFQSIQNVNDAARASVGWGGDRYAVVKTAGGNALVWVTAWDSGMDAAEFVDVLGQGIGKRYRTSAPTITLAGVRTYTGGTRTVVITPREIGGRSVVAVVDVPKGVAPDLLDLGKVGLSTSGSR